MPAVNDGDDVQSGFPVAESFEIQNNALVFNIMFIYRKNAIYIKYVCICVYSFWWLHNQFNDSYPLTELHRLGHLMPLSAAMKGSMKEGMKTDLFSL